MKKINLEQEQYSQEEVKAILDSLQEDFTTLETEVTEGEKAKEKVKELESDNLNNSIKLEATKVGLDAEDVFDLIEADSLEKSQEKINKLVEMKKQNKIDNSFKPKDKKKPSDEYAKQEKEGNVEGMLSSKLSNLFK